MAELRPAHQQFSATRGVPTRIASGGAKLQAFLRDGHGATLPVLGLTALILFLRRRDAFLNPQPWAEDAKVFFLQQWERGSQALITPYAGYLCTAQRVIAWLADALVSVADIPVFYNLAAFACSIFVAWFVLRSRLNVPYKPLLALVLVLVPHGMEVFLNVSNLQWIFGPLLVILAMQENPRSLGAACLDLGVLIVLGLTGPLAVILSPLLLLRPLLFGWNRYNKLFVSIALAVFVIQGWLIWNSARVGGADTAKNWVGIFRMVVREFVPQLFLGMETRTPWGLVLLLASCTATVRLWKGNSPPARRIQTMLLIALALVLGATIMVGPIPHTYNAFAGGQRYFYVPYVLIAWFYLLGLDSPQSRVRFIAAGISGMIMLAAATHLMSAPLPNLDWRGHVQPLAEGKTVTIPLNPDIVGSIVVRPRPAATRR